MRVIVTGMRGIPGVQGGIETHCAELYPRLVQLGFDITVCARKPYIKKQKKVFKGVSILVLPSPKSKFFEAIIHTFISIIYAYIAGFPIIHIHAIGPAILSPLARLLKLKVILTHHGFDYKRKKWNRIGKLILKLGEIAGIKFAHKVIIVSKTIQNIIEKKYKRFDTELIYNGVNLLKKETKSNYITQLGLKSKKYILAVGRFVPEKGFHDLLKAFLKLNLPDIKLVIAGDADHESEYSIMLKNFAKKTQCILPGFIQNNKLHQLYSHARLFVLPSYHEGLPIVLLEAISYNLDIIASDIIENKEIGLNETCYFKTGNIDDLYKHMLYKLMQKKQYNTIFTNIIREKFNWDRIARQTSIIYQELIK